MDLKVFAAFVVIIVVAAQCAAQDDIYVSNVSKNCLRCLCAASTKCKKDSGCSGGFCGPFFMSHVYYMDAIENTSMDKSEEAFKECSQNYKCAERVVTYYLAKFATDCNGDGVTDCTDYSMINFNGGYSCNQDLFRNDAGKQYAKRFLDCQVGI